MRFQRQSAKGGFSLERVEPLIFCFQGMPKSGQEKLCIFPAWEDFGTCQEEVDNAARLNVSLTYPVAIDQTFSSAVDKHDIQCCEKVFAPFMDSFLLYISYSYISDQQTHFSIRKKIT